MDVSERELCVRAGDTSRRRNGSLAGRQEREAFGSGLLLEDDSAGEAQYSNPLFGTPAVSPYHSLDPCACCSWFMVQVFESKAFAAKRRFAAVEGFVAVLCV